MALSRGLSLLGRIYTGKCLASTVTGARIVVKRSGFILECKFQGIFSRNHSLFCHPRPIFAGQSFTLCKRYSLLPNFFALNETRSLVTCSKKGKRKTVKAVAKRFKRVGNGLLKRWRSGKHNMRKKRTRRKKNLRRPVYVKGKQLKKLNKMLNGW